jgi:serine protease
MAVSAAAYASVITGSVETNPVRTHSHSEARVVPAGSVYRIIVKLRAGTSGPVGATQTLSAHARVANLAGRSGLALRESRQIFDRMHVLQVEPATAGDSLAATIEHLKADADVEYAVPDERRYIHAIPNDPLYSQGGQWYEQASTDTPAAVDVQSAWDYSTGDPNLVIADLDTGVRFDHPDLLAVANSGRLLPGYDFISDATIANDGDGRDADASDPGDWVNSTDKQMSAFKNCDTQISSWHGTRTAGLLGALTDNSHGVAGMTWQGKILPVRVLGKCGGYDSDIMAAMMWAAGLAVDGVPPNPYPARIINMSLGSAGSCPQSYSDIITKLASSGVLIVVSAGNAGGAVESPANCPGVAAVGGLRHAGTKVGYSSLGTEVTVSAPAGNCINQVGSCVYSIQTTTNSGSAGPVAGDDAYTGTQITLDEEPKGPNLGTSFSAPIVSGIAGLMVSVNSTLNACQLIARLQESSGAFPQTSSSQPAPPLCHVPTGSTDVQNLECICTLDGKTCGAGMANAKGAVQAALRPIAAVSLPASMSAGQPVTMSAQNSAAANGHTISSFQWTSIGKQTVSIQNATTSTATVIAPNCGLAIVQVAVTDDAGRVDTANVAIDPVSVSSAAPTNATDKSCSLAAPRVRLEVCPAAISVEVGSGTQAFTATVANTTDDSVTWMVNGVAGGSATLGTISSSGVYTAPANAPPSSQVTITAVSSADQTVAGSATLTVTTPSSSHGGGAMDTFTLLGEALALSVALASRGSREARLRSLVRRCYARR